MLSQATQVYMKREGEWFADWFDSEYYPVLYKNRDDQEAFDFISTLLQHLKLPSGSKVLDLACGRGRHSRYLHQSGFEVYGFDLSGESIKDARKQAPKGLRFFEHDMRVPFPVRELDAIFNLFTSFGYFDNEAQNISVLHNIYDSLQPQGVFVLDYLNAHWVQQHLVAHETKLIDGISFTLNRRIENKQIIKEISIRDGEKQSAFAEKVSAIFLHDFERLLHETGFTIKQVWGNYQGQNFDQESSKRVILICQRN